ncbi:hypothetical protein B0I32_13215 [Nonomuraea fuscirosea]|uniref:Uncharacterized protein n=1 Tax=Nonomuraea fuscirosea TaxID=1291556 RepID=A0A2T0M502_9ACTN|nr:hypothetical protein B0I32_13215 [Nonomuraea fuscirosea]
MLIMAVKQMPVRINRGCARPDRQSALARPLQH